MKMYDQTYNPPLLEALHLYSHPLGSSITTHINPYIHCPFPHNHYPFIKGFLIPHPSILQPGSLAYKPLIHPSINLLPKKIHQSIHPSIRWPPSETTAARLFALNKGLPDGLALATHRPLHTHCRPSPPRPPEATRLAGSRGSQRLLQHQTLPAAAPHDALEFTVLLTKTEPLRKRKTLIFNVYMNTLNIETRLP